MLDFNIISDFLSPSAKERIMYEISSPKKRGKAFERFSHSTEAIIRAEYIYYKGKSINDTMKIEIKKSVSECIVLSFEHELGKKMPIDEAFDYLCHESNVVIAVAGNYLIIKPEYEGGEALFYVLKKCF